MPEQSQFAVLTEQLHAPQHGGVTRREVNFLILAGLSGIGAGGCATGGSSDWENYILPSWGGMELQLNSISYGFTFGKIKHWGDEKPHGLVGLVRLPDDALSVKSDYRSEFSTKSVSHRGGSEMSAPSNNGHQKQPLVGVFQHPQPQAEVP